jgi:hypothetical protein
MSFLVKTPALPQTPAEAQRASSYKEADPIPLGWGDDAYGSHWLCQPFNWREATAGSNQPNYQYCSIISGYMIGPIDRIGKVFRDGKEIANLNYVFSSGEDSHEFTINPSLALGQAWKLILHRGSETDSPVAALIAATGQNHPPYRGTAWAEWINIDLGKGNTSLPSFALELGRDVPEIGSFGGGSNSPYGVNPFAALYAFFLEQKGGLDLNSELLDEDHWGSQALALESIGVGQRTGGLVCCHPSFSQVKDAAAAISEVLAYVDGYLYAAGGRLRVGWFPNNTLDAGSLPEITEHDLEEKPSGGAFTDWNQGATSAIVIFKDVTRGYAEAPALFQVPAARETGALSVPVRADRPFVHAADQAAIMAAEQAVGAVLDTGINLAVLKSRAVKGDGSPLMPGDLVNWDYNPHTLDLACRVVARRVRARQASDLLSIMRERGAFPRPYVAPVDSRVTPTPADPGVIDTSKVRIWFLPPGFGVSRQVAALIDRAKTGILGSTVYLSRSGSAPWEQIIQQSFFVAKCLATNGGISSSAGTLRVSSSSVDFARFAAQSIVAQEDDTLLVLIGDEVLSVGSISVVSSGVYDLSIIRGRRDTTAVAHADGVAAWLFLRSEMRTSSSLELSNVRDSTNTYDATIATKYFKIALFSIDQLGDPKPDDPGLSLVLPDLSADPLSGYTVVLTNEAHSVACDSSGNPLSGELGISGGTPGKATADLIVYRGSTQLSAVASSPNSDQFSFSIGTLTAATAQKVDNDTVVALTMTADTSKIELVVNVAGAITVTKIFSLSKVKTGSTGSTGSTGNFIERRYKRSTLVPSTPTGNTPAGWPTAIPSGFDALWVTEGVKDSSGNLVGSWSSPVRLSGNIQFFQDTAPTPSGYSLLENDTWWDTDDNNKLYRWDGSDWVAAFQPMLKFDGPRVVGLQKADGTDAAFVLVADYFQIWNGVSAEVPFEVASGVVRIKEAFIQSLSAGKITAGTIDVALEINAPKINASKLRGDSQIFNEEDDTRLFPTTSHVFDNLNGENDGGAEAYFTSADLIFEGWLRGSAGFSSRRFGHPDLRLDMIAAGGVSWSGAGGGTFTQFGPAYRTRTSGGAWGAWQAPGWVDLIPGGQTNCAVPMSVNADAALSGDMDIQVGVRMQTLGGGTGTIATGGDIWARIYNF